MRKVLRLFNFKTYKGKKMNLNLISIEDYARKKKVSVKTVYNWINCGKIKPVIIGKTKLIKAQ